MYDNKLLPNKTKIKTETSREWFLRYSKTAIHGDFLRNTVCLCESVKAFTEYLFIYLFIIKSYEKYKAN